MYAGMILSIVTIFKYALRNSDHTGRNFDGLDCGCLKSMIAYYAETVRKLYILQGRTVRKSRGADLNKVLREIDRCQPLTSVKGMTTDTGKGGR